MEHIDIINKIVEAEKTAKRIAEEAREQREHLEDDLKAERDSMRKNYFERADRRIESVREKEAAFAEETIAGLDAALAADIRSDDEAVARSLAHWIDTMFFMVLDMSETGGAENR